MPAAVVFNACNIPCFYCLCPSLSNNSLRIAQSRGPQCPLCCPTLSSFPQHSLSRLPQPPPLLSPLSQAPTHNPCFTWSPHTLRDLNNMHQQHSTLAYFPVSSLHSPLMLVTLNIPRLPCPPSLITCCITLCPEDDTPLPTHV